MKEKYLPLGTIVLLKGANKRLMITGFEIVKSKDKKRYDYCGCSFPEGLIDSKSMFAFNHDQIEKIYYMGYQDEEQKKFEEYIKNKAKKVQE